MIRGLPGVDTAWGAVSVDTAQHIVEQATGRLVQPGEALRRTAAAFTAPRRGAVHFAAQRRELGNISLMVMTASALRVDGAVVGGSERVHLGFVLSGSIVITPHVGDQVVLVPGAACSISDWTGFHAQSSDGTRCLSLSLPSGRLLDRGVRVRSGRVQIEGTRSLKGPLRGFALAVADSSWTATPVGEAVAERMLEDLVVGMFLESAGYAIDSEDLRAGLRARALAVISERHREADLNPRSVAEQLAVSLRHLQRAFEDSGTSIAGAITERRARTAALLLVSPAAASLTVEEIARRSGFSSAFELRAAFRAHIGMLPSQYREQRT